jgi:hypothetical protein
LEKLMPLLDMVEALSGNPSLSSSAKREKRNSSLGSPPSRSIERNEAGRVKSDRKSEEAGRTSESSGIRLRDKSSMRPRSNAAETDEMGNMNSSPWDHMPSMTGDGMGSGIGGFVSLSYAPWLSWYRSIDSRKRGFPGRITGPSQI